MGSTQFELDDFNLNNSEVSWNAAPSRDPRDLGGRVTAMQNPNMAPVTNMNMLPTTNPNMTPITNPNITLSATPNATPVATPNAIPIANTNENIEFAPPENPLMNSANAFPQSEILTQPNSAPDMLQQSPEQFTAPAATLENSEIYAKHEIKTADKLADAGIEAVDKAISKLGRDGNAAEFYEISRDMAEDNLVNSYIDRERWGR